MNETGKRALLYGSAALVIGGIAVAWANTNNDADVVTLLSGADVQLRMAYVLPVTDKQGQRMTSRDDLIDYAIEQLSTVERVQPGLAATAEFRGFAHMLRGEFVEAAGCYRDAQGRADCQDEQRDVLAFNEARMLAKGGRLEQALSVFGKHATRLDARFGHQRAIEEAAILRELGRPVDSADRLAAVVADDAASSMARLLAGREYAALGHAEEAERAFVAAGNELPIAYYDLARLKLASGDVDSCFDSLRRAIGARPTEVRQRLRDEAEAWSAVAQDARFVEIKAQEPASPGR